MHWRGLPVADVDRVRDELLVRWRTAGIGEGGITLHEFDGGIELRDQALHKGMVIRTRPPLGDDGVLAYLGDDLTDEDAFREVPASGLAVLVRPEPRPTLARLWLRPPVELRGSSSRAGCRSIAGSSAMPRQRLIVVSNRLPFVFGRKDGRLDVQPGSGGLVTTLVPVLRRRGGVWVGLARHRRNVCR